MASSKKIRRLQIVMATHVGIRWCLSNAKINAADRETVRMVELIREMGVEKRFNVESRCAGPCYGRQRAWFHRKYVLRSKSHPMWDEKLQQDFSWMSLLAHFATSLSILRPSPTLEQITSIGENLWLFLGIEISKCNLSNEILVDEHLMSKEVYKKISVEVFFSQSLHSKVWSDLRMRYGRHITSPITLGHKYNFSLFLTKGPFSPFFRWQFLT